MNTNVRTSESPPVINVPGYEPPNKEESKKEEPKKDLPKKEETNRHEKWKLDQQKAKQQREEQAAKKAAEKAKMVPELLRKGNAFEAARALGISVSEFAELSQKALVGIPTKEEELSPEQKKERDYDQYRKDSEAKIKWLQDEHVRATKKSWVSENIKPHVDAEKYPLLTARKETIPGMMDGLYEYFNQKYSETVVRDDNGNIVKQGWIPNEQDVQDALETLEKQYEDQAEQQIAHYKKIGKFSKHFTAEQKAEEQALVEAANEEKIPTEYQETDPGDYEQDENPHGMLANMKGSLAKASKEPTWNINRSGADVPFALLSAKEKAQYIRNHPDHFNKR